MLSAIDWEAAKESVRPSVQPKKEKGGGGVGICMVARAGRVQRENASSARKSRKRRGRWSAGEMGDGGVCSVQW